MPEATPATTNLPWWRHGLVWMVIGGPALVVVAGIATFVIAARSPDPIVVRDAYRLEGQALTAPGEARDKGMLPAQQGRNHAASPVPAR